MGTIKQFEQVKGQQTLGSDFDANNRTMDAGAQSQVSQTLRRDL